jgi:hypothetical protein
VIVFAVAGLLALGLVTASGIVVVRRLAADEALSEARQLTAISARVVERRVNDGLLTGDAESLAAIALVVFPAVLGGRSQSVSSERWIVLTGRPCSGWVGGPKGGHRLKKGWRMIVFHFSGALRRGSLK